MAMLAEPKTRTHFKVLTGRGREKTAKETQARINLAAPMSVTIGCRKNKDIPIPTPAGHALSGWLSYTDQ